MLAKVKVNQARWLKRGKQEKGGSPRRKTSGMGGTAKCDASSGPSARGWQRRKKTCLAWKFLSGKGEVIQRAKGGRGNGRLRELLRTVVFCHSSSPKVLLSQTGGPLFSIGHAWHKQTQDRCSHPQPSAREHELRWVKRRVCLKRTVHGCSEFTCAGLALAPCFS